MNTITVKPDPSSWNPIRGTCFNAIHAPTDVVRQEAVAVMSRCINPATLHGKRTGLVVGYVQSGKTSSFTSVAALARDNEFQLVIVVSGSSTALYKQSADRVIGDLTRAEPNGWVPIRSEEISAQNIDQHVQTIDRSLRFWNAQGIAPSARKTILLCVMKNAHHLGLVQEVLSRVALAGVRALLIDDEADQASMNFARVPGGRTGIYALLNGIRQLLPQVTYLQYTATPQAPLLIRLDDALSPEFCKVLTAGSTFTGPARFFDQDAKRLVREITQADISNAQSGTAPRALQSALAFYFLGVAAHLLNPESSGVNNRTMMVHPSQNTSPHEDYRAFVEGTIDRWKSAVTGQVPAESASVQRVFQQAFIDLDQGVEGVTFDELWAQIPNALELTAVEVMNSKPTGTKQINWNLQYHILIGGAMLDRGFTVEGLTVTYMPRELGTGSADNIQQRARWFGYKEKYIGYCRVWLQRASIDAYTAILEHEENMRESLRLHSGPLRDWRRKFFLEPGLRLTRHQVVRLDLVRGSYNGGWFEQKAPRGGEPVPTQRNRDLVQELFTGELFEFFGRREWTENLHGEIAREVALSKVNEFLQTFAPEADADSTRLIGLAMQTTEYAKDNPNATCSVVKMGFANDQWHERVRQQTDRLHQGKNPSYPVNPNAYPGDAARRDDCLTVQIFKMKSSDGSVRDIPAIAVYVPKEMAKHWLVEDR